MKNLPLAAQNLTRVWRRRYGTVTSAYSRQVIWGFHRTVKWLTGAAKAIRARMNRSVQLVPEAVLWIRRRVKRVRYYRSKVQERTFDRVGREFAVGRGLRATARGSQPIIVGPWLSEVGFEVLYWGPFLRWFCDHYRVPSSRLVIVSRGGVQSWYAGVADHYVELLDLLPIEEFAELNTARQRAGEQKQHRLGPLDEEILRRLRTREGLAEASVCHPSMMFRLLGQFWLGNESLEYLLDHVRYETMAAPSLPPDIQLPERFAAVKFYSGLTLPDTDEHHAQLTALVSRVASEMPVVSLETGLRLDDHRDYSFRDVPGVRVLSDRLKPQQNLAIQTAVIGRAEKFFSTCGSLAWLGPMVGTPTVGVYTDDRLLTPHLYAARSAYHAMGAAPFAAIDLHALSSSDLVSPGHVRQATPLESDPPGQVG